MMSEPQTQSRGGVRREGDLIAIRFPAEELHALRVALAPCPCKSPKSNSTASIRKRISDGLARLAGKN